MTPGPGWLDRLMGRGGGGAPAPRKADFSDVQAGGSSTAPAQTTYKVVKGDSLSKIAQRVYGDPKKWQRIYDANKDVIKNPDLIYPGQDLRIPPA
ncbi:MAG: LysM peptidoglycan-binding domain-containing protein [Gemmatimonadales bacterium]